MQVSDLLGPGWGPKICIPNRFPGDADAISLKTLVSWPLD